MSQVKYLGVCLGEIFTGGGWDLSRRISGVEFYDGKCPGFIWGKFSWLGEFFTGNVIWAFELTDRQLLNSYSYYNLSQLG